jgi:hypothetical protein
MYINMFLYKKIHDKSILYRKSAHINVLLWILLKSFSHRWMIRLRNILLRKKMQKGHNFDVYYVVILQAMIYSQF